MPKDAKPLSTSELMLVYEWIQEGAKR